MVHSDSSWFMVDSSWKNLKLPHPLSAAGEERVDQLVPIAIGIGVSKRSASGNPHPFNHTIP